MIIAETVTMDAPDCTCGDWLDAWAVFDAKVSVITGALAAFRVSHQLAMPSVRYVLRAHGETRYVPYSELVEHAVAELLDGRAIWAVCSYDPYESSELWTVDRTDGAGWGC